MIVRLPKTLKSIGFCALLASATLPFTHYPVQAQQSSLRIAAVVNDNLISIYDLNERIEMAILSSGLQDNQNTRQRLAEQTLRQLIDEQIKLQAADEKSISVRDTEVTKQIGEIEKRNKMPQGQLMRVFQARGVDPETLRTQVRSQIAWAKLVARELRRRVNIGEDEIDEQLELARQDSDKLQKRVFEIFLPLESPEREVEVRQNVSRMIEQLRAGANFSGMARNFSQSGSASLGGDRGWLLPAELPPELEEVVTDLQPGEISEPIETLTGFYILQVADERKLGGSEEEIELTFSQISLPLVGGSEDARARSVARAEELRAGIDGCSTVTEQAETVEGSSVVAESKAKLGDLSALVRQNVETLEKGETSAPIALSDAVLLITLCDRVATDSNLPSRREIRNRLAGERLELLERQYLRDLRQAAFIDIRL